MGIGHPVWRPAAMNAPGAVRQVRYASARACKLGARCILLDLNEQDRLVVDDELDSVFVNADVAIPGHNGAALPCDCHDRMEIFETVQGYARRVDARNWVTIASSGAKAFSLTRETF